jgi:hypothetical protein
MQPRRCAAVTDVAGANLPLRHELVTGVCAVNRSVQLAGFRTALAGPNFVAALRPFGSNSALAPRQRNPYYTVSGDQSAGDKPA